MNGLGEQLEGDVLARARAGDERAFLALYRAANPGLLRYLTVLAGDQAVAVAEQTWYEISCDLADYQGGLEDFRGWVAAVARRRALELIAARDRTTTVAGEPGLHPPQTRRALQLIAELPLEQSEVLLLRTVVGLDEATTAAVLGLRRARVRGAARRAAAALHLRLGVVAALPRRHFGRQGEPAGISSVPAARRPPPGDFTPPRGLPVSS